MNFNPPFEQLAQFLFPGSRLLRVWPLAGGISAGMTGLEIQLVAGQLRRLVLRQPGAAALRHNPRALQNEYRLLQRLHGLGLAVPKPLFLDTCGKVIPTPYLVLEYIEGHLEFAPTNLAGTVAQLAAQLAGIHRARLTPEEISFLPAPAGDLLDLPAAADPSFAVSRVHAALKAVWPIPVYNAPALLHGDYWPGNLLWHAGQLAAVIDWEDAAFGDPLVDVAITRLDLLWIFGEDALQAFNEQYFALLPLDTRCLPYWDLYAALRLARLAGADLEGWAAFFHPYGRTDISAQSIRTHYRDFVKQAFEIIG